jgi:hypothetical protein
MVTITVLVSLNQLALWFRTDVIEQEPTPSVVITPVDELTEQVALVVVNNFVPSPACTIVGVSVFDAPKVITFVAAP